MMGTRHAALACVLRRHPRGTQVDKQRLVRFFDQKGFYTVHGESALFIARQYYRTTAVIKYFGSVDTGLPGLVLRLTSTHLGHRSSELSSPPLQRTGSARPAMEPVPSSAGQWK